MRSRMAPALFCVACLLAVTGLVAAADPESDVLAGHSYHGEAFNEGPRQSAYLMPGMGNVEFPTSTESELAQRFINQGVAQLHGFWYYEAERSFRQAAVLDPDCAIAYWGMGMANRSNLERARGFIAEAVAKKENTSEREQLYIDAFDNYCKEKDGKGKKIDKKARAQTYIHDMEQIVEEHPDDIEAKAFLAVHMWQSARDLPIISHVAVNSIIQDVFDANPMHPSHHYRIHLWDRHKAKRALESSALCGPSLPGIAHMWHMPGHIYDKLHRYHDAVWQQEASARVDHAHMMRDRVLPDQIHNFAHNNEWFIRNMLKIGRVEDALSLARNMLELPRHPKYNTLKKRGSTKYGRERLLLALSSYRLWPELIEFADTMYLEATDIPEHQVERLKYLGLAHALSGQIAKADAILEDLNDRAQTNKQTLSDLEPQEDSTEGTEKTTVKTVSIKKEKEKDGSSASEADTDKAESEKTDTDEQAAAKKEKKKRDDRLKELKEHKKRLEKATKSVEIAIAANKKEWKRALKGWKASGLSDNLLKAEWLLADGQEEACLKLLDKEIDDKPGQLLALATKSWILFSTADAEKAKSTFEQVRTLAATADLKTPMLSRLAPLAEELGFSNDWSAEIQLPKDIGDRPNLDSLGSFRWHPYIAPDFSVHDKDGHQLGLKQLRGSPTLVIFYLGFGCLHCVEQLHAFSPRANEFRDAGIDVIAISTEDRKSLNTALGSYDQPLDLPLHTDPELKAFKAYRCFDDFEEQPLHGTFLIDSDGRVLWQDISYEPFMDVDFVLAESHRLLTLSQSH